MTIAALVVDPPYVLVAADRRWTNPVTGEHGEHHSDGRPYIKVHVHPVLPSVWVAAGTDMPRGPVENLCDPRAGADTAAAISRLFTESDREESLSVLIGGLGTACRFWFRGSEYGAENIRPGGHLCPSPHTTAFCEALPDSAFPPPRGSHPRDIAKHLRRLLKDAIASAREIAGDDADVGGYVDVALAGPPGGIAGPRGARIY